jgi:hypothetical protein
LASEQGISTGCREPKDRLTAGLQLRGQSPPSPIEGNVSEAPMLGGNPRVRALVTIS